MTDQNQPISFVTFGMFILDEIEWQTPNPPTPKYNLIGGAGTYAILGARLAASPSRSLSRTISWIVDVGSDFPTNVKSTIDSWDTNCVFRYDSSRLTTRAWNGYGVNDFRSFKYLTPKVRLEVSSLNSAQIMAKSFHMVCSPDRCIDITTKLREARIAIDPQREDPVIVWEPIPDLCSPEQLSRLQEAARRCTVISPNHEELKMFFPPDISESKTQLQLVTRLMGWSCCPGQPTPPLGCSSYPIVVVREGSNGSTAYVHPTPTSPQDPSPTEPIAIHLSAYHTPDMSSSVTDPTGGGNTYLGALAITLGLYATNSPEELPIQAILNEYLPVPMPATKSQARTQTLSTTEKITIATLTHALIASLIAASFAIEQNGTPVLHRVDNNDNISRESTIGQCAGDTPAIHMNGHKEYETWNGETMEQRTHRYLMREAKSITEQLRATESMTGVIKR